MRSKITAFLKRKDSSVAQAIKYIISGGISVLVVQVTFYLLAWLVFPCMRATDPIARLLTAMGFSVRDASEDEIKRNFWIIMIICFVFANTVVYLLNARYVFRTGRHRKPIEVLLFFGSSLFQFLFIWFGGVLITVFKWEVTYSNILMLFVGLVVNFVIRKKVVFKG
jgi:putative flippase GtrA